MNSYKQIEKNHTLNTEANLPTDLSIKDMTDAEKFAHYKKEYDTLVDLCVTNRYTTINGKTKKNSANKEKAKVIYDGWKLAGRKGDLFAKYSILQYALLKRKYRNQASTLDSLFRLREECDYQKFTTDANNSGNAIAYANLGFSVLYNFTYNPRSSYLYFFVAYLLSDDAPFKAELVNQLEDTQSPFHVFKFAKGNLHKNDIIQDQQILKEFVRNYITPKHGELINQKLDAFIQGKLNQCKVGQEKSSDTKNNNNNHHTAQVTPVSIFKSTSQESLSSESIDDEEDSLQLQIAALRLSAKHHQEQEALSRKQAAECNELADKLEKYLQKSQPTKTY